MKIAIFSDNFYPELSGISDSIITTGRLLAERGHQIHFFAPRYPQTNQELSGENIYVQRLWSFPYPGPTGQSRVVIPAGRTLLAVHKIKPDVLHTHLFFGVGFEALIATRVLNIPLVGTNHTPIGEFIKYGPIRGAKFENWALKMVAWYYNHCAFVSAPSRGAIDELEAYGFKKSAEVISNPIRTQIFTPVNKKMKQNLKQKFSLSKNTVLYTGRLSEEKHIDVILRALQLIVQKIPGVTLVITGRGTCEGDLKKLARDLGLTDRVKFFGILDLKSLVELYQAADAFAIASTAETQSISLMQAMACGLPVVGVRARGLAEYIKPENGFLVEPGDYKTMADKLLEMLFNETLKDAMGKSATIFASQFSPQVIAQKWEEIYKKYSN